MTYQISVLYQSLGPSGHSVSNGPCSKREAERWKVRQLGEAIIEVQCYGPTGKIVWSRKGPAHTPF